MVEVVIENCVHDVDWELRNNLVPVMVMATVICRWYSQYMQHHRHGSTDSMGGMRAIRLLVAFKLPVILPVRNH